ncbi:hypothetical protein [Amycolatopsis sp. lyj-23]|uniref:hypothetical protein n=1 Tax=Amycolatopsis sp. lyj-23 TaxID=2789283 RepID=UPI00397E84D7
MRLNQSSGVGDTFAGHPQLIHMLWIKGGQRAGENRRSPLDAGRGGDAGGWAVVSPSVGAVTVLASGAALSTTLTTTAAAATSHAIHGPFSAGFSGLTRAAEAAGCE